MKKQEITIPKGCRAIIEDGIVIIEEIKHKFRPAIDWPKETDEYFYPSFNPLMYFDTLFRSDNGGDIFRKKHNLCFRTKEEATAKTKEFLNIK